MRIAHALLAACLLVAACTPRPLPAPNRTYSSDCGGAPIVVQVLRTDDTYIWDGKPIDKTDLKAAFLQAKERRPIPNLLIRADAETRFENVNRVVLASMLADYPCKSDLKGLN